MGSHNTRVQRWLELLTAFDYTLEYRKRSANGNAAFLSRLPEPATQHGRSGSTSLNLVVDGGTYLTRACGLSTPSSPIPGVGLGGLVPRTESAVLGGIPFTSADFRDFRAHGPRMWIDDISAHSGSFVACVSASVATVDRCPGRARALPAADNAFASGFVVPTEVGTGSGEAPVATTTVADSIKAFYKGDRRGRDSRPDRVRLCLAWLSGAPDSEAVFGPHLHSDALA